MLKGKPVPLWHVCWQHLVITVDGGGDGGDSGGGGNPVLTYGNQPCS